MSNDFRRMERFIRRFKKWDKVEEIKEEDIQELDRRDINEILIAIKSIAKARLFRLSDRYDMKMQIMGKILETGVDAVFKLDFSDMKSSDDTEEPVEIEIDRKYRVLLALVKRMNKKIPERMDFVDNWFESHQREMELLTLSFGIAIKTINMTINLVFSKK